MPDEVRASCINNDLRGTVAVDGHGHSPLMDWWDHVEGEKEGYRPVGVRVGRVTPDDEGKISITMYAALCKEAGSNVDDWLAFEKKTEVLPTYPFEARMTVDEFFRHIKRLAIVALPEDLVDKNVKSYNHW